MLLPTTWSLVWLTFRPERPVNRALVNAMRRGPCRAGRGGRRGDCAADARPLRRRLRFDCDDRGASAPRRWLSNQCAAVLAVAGATAVAAAPAAIDVTFPI